MRVVAVASSVDSITLQSGGSEDAYVFAGNTLSAGGSALASAGVTYSALPSGSGIVIVAEDSTSIASIGDALDLSVTTGGESGLPTPVMLPAGSQQLVTISGEVYTTFIANSITNNGTLSFNSTTAAQTAETSSSTHGLGDAIMSGIGGGVTSSDEENSSPSSETTAAETSSGAAKMSAYILLGELAVVGFVLGLL